MRHESCRLEDSFKAAELLSCETRGAFLNTALALRSLEADSFRLRFFSLHRPRKRRCRIFAGRGQCTPHIGLLVHEISESILDVGPQCRDVGVVPARLVHAR